MTLRQILRTRSALFSQSSTSKLVSCRCFAAGASQQADNYYDEDQKAIQKTLRKIIDNEINPHVDKWEKEEAYPAHEVFKKLGMAGLLGVNKPEGNVPLVR